MHAGTQSASISRILRFSRFCAYKAPYTTISWDFVHAGARRASLSRAVCTEGLQMLLDMLHFPGILCTQGFHMLQFPGTLAHKDSKCREPEILCMEGVEMLQLQGQYVLIAKDSNVLISQVHHWSTCRLYRLGSKNSHPGQSLIQTWATPFVNETASFYRAYSGRGRISNMYKYALTYLIPGEYNMYNFAARW